MLDDPFSLPLPPASSRAHTGPRPSLGTSTASRLAAPESAKHEAPFSLLLSGTASKYKSSSAMSGPGAAAFPLAFAAGKENALLPSPRFGTSTTTASSASSSSAGSSSSPAREGVDLVRKGFKPSLKRRVTFSPTPLASLQSSPSRTKRRRVDHLVGGLLFSDEHERVAKRARRRENVYSDNPLLEAARGTSGGSGDDNRFFTRPQLAADSDAASGSDVRAGGSSSPPGSSSTNLKRPLLPRSPPRSRRSVPTTYWDEAENGWVLTGLVPRPFPSASAFAAPREEPIITDEVAGTADGDDMTDSEEESEQVESLLLPSPEKRALAAFAPPPPSVSAADGPFAATLSGVDPAIAAPFASSSSSPLKSPSLALIKTPRPSTSLLVAAELPLRSILKQRPSAPNCLVKDEREGLRKNGRGRRHVVGWDTENKTKLARERKRDEQAGTKQASEEAREAEAGGGGKGKGKAKDSNEGAAPKASTSRETRSTSRGAKGPPSRPFAGTSRGAGQDEDDEPPRRRRNGDDMKSGPMSSSSARVPGGNATNGRRRPKEPKGQAALDDPTWFRSPLLVLCASLRDCAGAPAVRPTLDGSTQSMLPRPHAAVSARVAATVDDQPTPFLGNVTTLSDVEDAYVSLKNAVYCMPDELADPERTLQPLRAHAEEMVSSMIRDIGNVRTFPTWVSEHPVPQQNISAGDDPMQVDDQRVNADLPSSSPSRKPPTSQTTTSPTKLSLTETQMSRMRDELSTALAAIKCASIVFRNEWTLVLFDPADVAKVIKEIASIASTPGLSVSVRREISPFLPFFFASVSKPAATILAPLLTTSVLPALQETLSLDPRVDRYRAAMSESLDALVELLREHGRAMLVENAWKSWLLAATMGLWDGSKKMVSTCDRALKVLGRVAHLLTEPVPTTDPWHADCQAAHQAISAALKELFTSSPADAPLDKLDKSGGQLRMTYIRLLMDQLGGEAETMQGDDEEAIHRSLSALSALAMVPVLLGRQFRRIASNGIGPWLRPFNNISRSASNVVLALSALSWPHMAYAFLSVEPKGVSKTPWLFYKPLTAVHYLKIFESRSERWDRAPDPKADATKHEMVCQHAEALVLAFVAVVYGATACIQRSVASGPPRTENDDFLERIFDAALMKYLPIIAHSPVSRSVNLLGWQILSSICRAEPADVETAGLDALVNPVLLDGNMANLLPHSGALEALLSPAMQQAVRPEDIPGWGEAWLSRHVGQMLSLFRNCLPSAGPHFDGLQVDVVRAWMNLLDAVAQQPAAISEIVSEIVKLSVTRPDVSRFLWTALFDKHDAVLEESVESALRADARAFALALRCWLDSPQPPASWTEPLSRITKGRLAQSLSNDANDTFEIAVALLQHRIELIGLDSSYEGQDGLAQAIGHAAWHKDETSERLIQTIASRTDAAETSLRLCVELVVGMRSFASDAQLRGVRACENVFDQVFAEGHVAKGCLDAIDKLLQSASDVAYPALYEALLSRLNGAIALTTADLGLYADVIAGPLRRSLEQLSTAAGTNETQMAESLLARVPSYTSPIQSFQKFWKATFGGSPGAYEIPASLVELLKIVTSISDGFSVPGYEETMPVANDSLPAAGQGRGTLTTSTTDRTVSARGYDADTSRQPRVRLSDTTADPSSKLATRSTARNAAYSPSLRMPAESGARADVPAEIASAGVVISETPEDVRAEAVQQTYAELSRQLQPRSASRSTESADVAPSRKRARTNTASSDGRSSADDSGAEVVSSGRRRVGKRYRDKSKSGRAANGRADAPSAPTAPAAVGGQADTSSLELPSSSIQSAREEELVRGFLNLPFETVVQVGRRIGGSPSLRRLIDLGDKAREYFESFGSGSP